VTLFLFSVWCRGESIGYATQYVDAEAQITDRNTNFALFHVGAYSLCINCSATGARYARTSEFYWPMSNTRITQRYVIHASISGYATTLYPTAHSVCPSVCRLHSSSWAANRTCDATTGRVATWPSTAVLCEIIPASYLQHRWCVLIADTCDKRTLTDKCKSS